MYYILFLKNRIHILCWIIEESWYIAYNHGGLLKEQPQVNLIKSRQK